ncbi:hypothetical protein [Streptomyces hoynatensis]|uniref:Uncharacterized protein n=1 Tax=Streptomyces hoynatensis TaxID=1141874 RepID=A0A3A9YWN8_9ACTN|nr:hypothetical protein [Streptomyces hoynatensis]RKN40418.1 hypothetical protein D7294_18385 [Streptomyces hoynatensis]
MSEPPATPAAPGDPRFARAVLALPGCPPRAREAHLARCTDAGLAAFAAALPAAAARELRRRTPRVPAMTPELLKEPTPAQAVLAARPPEGELFDAAVALLPGPPADLRPGQDARAWLAAYRPAFTAWRLMWRDVLRAHPARHARLLALTEGTPAQTVIRDHLLGTLPWAVEPGLLAEVARADLERFAGAVLATRVCRLLEGGRARDEVWAEVAPELAALPQAARPLPESYLVPGGAHPSGGHNAAVDWITRAANTRWRHLLHPGEAAAEWRCPAAELAALAAEFAQRARQALGLWDPAEARPRRRADQLRWVRAMLRHLPGAPTAEVREGVARLLAGASPVDAEAAELLAAIACLAANPGPDAGDAATAATAEGDEARERALTAHAARGGDAAGFAGLLAAHSAPAEALLRLTRELQVRLGGGAEERAAWVRLVLDAPPCTPQAVRALPAWAALRAGHPAVEAVVAEALGEDAAAWERFAAAPVAPEGERAWLPLSGLLAQAADGPGEFTPPGATP